MYYVYIDHNLLHSYVSALYELCWYNICRKKNNFVTLCMCLRNSCMAGWHGWCCIAVLASAFNKKAFGITDFFNTSNLHLRTLNWSLFRVLKCDMFWIYCKKKTQKPKEKKTFYMQTKGKNDKQSVDCNKNFYQLNIYKHFLEVSFYWLLVVISIETSVPQTIANEDKFSFLLCYLLEWKEI